MNAQFADVYRISQQHLIDVCKYRQPQCCRYICFPSSGEDFYCIKSIEDLKNKIDAEITGMNAQVDNCPGLHVKTL